MDNSRGFYTPIDKLRTHEFRVQIADILRKMGGVCDEIVMAYGEVRRNKLGLFMKDWLDELDEIDQQFRFGEKTTQRTGGEGN